MKVVEGDGKMGRCTKGEKKWTEIERTGAIYDKGEKIWSEVASGQLYRFYLLFSSETLGKDIIISQLEFDSFLAV